jgi:hypothetical protein
VKSSGQPLPGFETLFSENISEKPLPGEPKREVKRTTKTISENISEIGRTAAKPVARQISENLSKKHSAKRGRKPKYTQEDYAPFVKMRKWKPSLRAKQNHVLARRAYGILQLAGEEFAWILGSQKRGQKHSLAYKSARLRLTTLAELGRFQKDGKSDDQAILSAAKQICADRMNARQAIGYCRRLRKKGKPSAGALAKAIRRVIQKYRDRHPKLSDSDIGTALRMAAGPKPRAGQDN